MSQLIGTGLVKYRNPLAFVLKLFLATVLLSECCFWHFPPPCMFQEKVRLQYRLTFMLGEQEHSESGSVEQFPPPEKWGNL